MVLCYVLLLFLGLAMGISFSWVKKRLYRLSLQLAPSAAEDRE